MNMGLLYLNLSTTPLPIGLYIDVQEFFNSLYIMMCGSISSGIHLDGDKQYILLKDYTHKP